MSASDALTAQDVADILRIAKNTVYELVKRGELRCYRVGSKFRFDRADVDAYKAAARGAGASSPAVQAPLSADFVRVDPPRRAVSPSGTAADSFVLCGQDVLLDILARRLEAHPDGMRALRSYQGSYNGLQALYAGGADAASCHLWDGDTGTYNIPYLRHLLPGTPVVVLRLASRRVGYYVAEGNPKSLAGWADLARRDLSMVNRERGSGIRILLDERLRLAGLAGSSLDGYGHECATHLAVASAIARGGADFGLGSEKACRLVPGVDFVPLQEERYDLVFRAADADLPVFRALAAIVRSDEFREELAGLGGYGLEETGRAIAAR